MVMEIGTLGSTRWTDNSPRPFARSPGAGMGAFATPRRKVHPGFSGLHESGFAAEDAVPAGTPTITMDPTLVLGTGPFTVIKQTVGAGQIPSLLIKFYYTDRGALTQDMLDQQVKAFVKAAGFKVSRATSFVPMAVNWKWEHDTQADFYYPVVSSPAAITGMKYSGNAVQLPVYTADASVLAKLPNSIYVYTLAVTSGNNTMTDGEAAQVLTLLKQAMVNMASANGYANVNLILLGSPPEVFEEPSKPVIATVISAGASGLLLVVAWNLLSAHIGSEHI